MEEVSTVTVEPPVNKKCIDCQTEISLFALKCTKCGSYQDWRRHLPIGQNVLALFIALISVLGITIPAVLGSFHRDNSEIKSVIMSYGVSGNYQVRNKVFFTNLGNRPAIVTSSYVMLINHDGDTVRLSDRNEFNYIIEPGKSLLADFNFYLPGLEPNRVNPDRGKPYLIVESELVIHISNFDTSHTTIKYETGGASIGEFKNRDSVRNAVKLGKGSHKKIWG